MGPTERGAPEGHAAEVEYLEPVGDDGEGGGVGWRLSSASSSGRVMAGGRRLSRRHLGALVTALLAVGLAVTWIGDDRDRGGDSAGAGDAAGAVGDAAADDEMKVTDVADVSAAYARAVVRLGRAHTFAFRGTVRSEDMGIVRPGPRIAEEVTVEGAVHLPLSITTEVAVASNGDAVETVTSGPAVWARRAADVAGLVSADWTVVGEEEHVSVPGRRPGGLPPSRLGVTSVVDAVRAGGDRRSAPRDDQGRQVIRATVPEHRGRGIIGSPVFDVVGGAELAVTLDDDGDIARIELTGASDGPTLELSLDIVDHGDSTLITPADLADPVGSSVPPGAVREVGLGSLDMPGLPTTWALTEASVLPADVVSEMPAGCAGPVLFFTYNDLAGVAEGRLTLSARQHACAGAGAGVRIGTAPRDELDVSAGRFSGSAESSAGNLYGEVTDGTTSISFTTDLPVDELAAAVASLEPADRSPDS